jgi:hypothetical protein
MLTSTPPAPVSFWQDFRFWLKLGCIGCIDFGSPEELGLATYISGLRHCSWGGTVASAAPCFQVRSGSALP